VHQDATFLWTFQPGFKGKEGNRHSWWFVTLKFRSPSLRLTLTSRKINIKMKQDIHIEKEEGKERESRDCTPIRTRTGSQSARLLARISVIFIQRLQTQSAQNAGARLIFRIRQYYPSLIRLSASTVCKCLSESSSKLPFVVTYRSPNGSAHMSMSHYFTRVPDV